MGVEFPFTQLIVLYQFLCILFQTEVSMLVFLCVVSLELWTTDDILLCNYCMLKRLFLARLDNNSKHILPQERILFTSNIIFPVWQRMFSHRFTKSSTLKCARHLFGQFGRSNTSFRLPQWLPYHNLASTLTLLVSFKMQHGSSRLSPITMFPTPTALSVPASSQDPLTFWRALHSTLQWQ